MIDVFGNPVTCLITRGESTVENYHETSTQIISIIGAAVDCGVSMVQIREKQLSAKALFSLVIKARDITSGAKTKLLVNNRLDVAMAAGADGVHLSTKSMPTDMVRSIVPSDFIVGRSTHTVEEAQAAKLDGANCVVFGPVFATLGKGDGVGLETLAGVCSELESFRVIALGGIDSTNCELVLASGASGVAGIGAFNDPECLGVIARKCGSFGKSE